MDVIISGQAGIFASLKPAFLYRLDDDLPVPVKSHNIGLAFGGCSDVQRMVVGSLKEARRVCQVEWANDRTLRSVLSFLDRNEERVDRLDFAECAEELFAEYSTDDFILARLFNAPLPEQADLSLVDEIRTQCPRTAAIIDVVAADQAIIRTVAGALHEAIKRTLNDADERRTVEDAITKVGASRRIVELLKAKSSIDFFVLQLIAQFRQLSGAREVIELWTDQMRSKKKIDPVHTSEEADYGSLHITEGVGIGRRRAFEQAMKQQAAIVEKLKARDLDGARRYARDLLQSQRLTSAPEHIGKSLSNLSHQAKELGVPELQIEWAEMAVAENAADPLTFSHLADALISAFRFNEAEKAISSIESLGATLSAANARARILRMAGKFSDAREVFLQAATDHPYDETVTYSLQGAAECLRDMNRYEEALAEYEQLTENHPLEGSMWAGRASTLMDLGRFDEAIKIFGISESKTASGRVPRNGKASAYKRRGDLFEALKLYNEIVREFPHDPVALCGRAEVYRDQGRLDLALEDFRVAVSCSPFTPGPLIGLIETLKDLRQFDEAACLLDEAMTQFSLHAGIASLRADLLARLSKLPEALAAYDQLVLDFPFHTHARKRRADVLRRMGKQEDALKEYEAIEAEVPHYQFAKLAKLSLLIELGRSEEAIEQFSSAAPKSELEWRFYFLRASAVDAMDGAKKSDHLFRNGMRAPFAKQRRVFKAALGRVRLIRQQASESLKIIDAAAGEVSNVVWLHALAASGRKERAKRTFNEIVSTETSATIIELSREIAARFKLVEGIPQLKSREWIFEAERRELLLEIAA